MKKRPSVVAIDGQVSLPEINVLTKLNLSTATIDHWRETFTATKLLNSLILKYSNESALLITNLPMPGGDPTSPIPYTMQAGCVGKWAG